MAVSTTPIRIGLVGIGKIARDQHLPALMSSADFQLAAAVSRHGPVAGIETFADIESMIRAAPQLDAVSLCTPPSGRQALARLALAAGLHVMLEKPPGASVGEVLDLEARARAGGMTLFATWHSREAAGVEPATAWLAKRTVTAVRVAWKEDIRVWHPGQEWILAPAGLGVFDPGINALSILTRILPQRLSLRSGSLSFPANRAAPIAAQLDFIHGDTAPVTAHFDFLYSGPQSWDIEVDTDAGQLLLTGGGRQLRIDGVEQVTAPDREYPALYSRFRALIAGGMSDVDVSPLQHVADAFMLARRLETAAFEF